MLVTFKSLVRQIGEPDEITGNMDSQASMCFSCSFDTEYRIRCVLSLKENFGFLNVVSCLLGYGRIVISFLNSHERP